MANVISLQSINDITLMTNLKRVLIIEDDKDISRLLQLQLTDMQFEADTAYDGIEGLKKALSGNYDFIMIDLMLPGMDGLEICRQIRINKLDTPVMMLTSRSEEIDKVLGLETGADDYMTKPFSSRELQARIKAIMRRVNIPQTDVKSGIKIFEVDELFVDLEKRIVKVRNESLNLTPKEFELLALLIQNPGKTYSRMDLLNLVWNYNFEGYEHTVNSHINRLRSKIEVDMNKPQYVLTTWGVGYRFKEFGANK
jgi:two-component system, OmpR family, alkaline phosphatase synthesis response regulator PhoP